MKTIFIKSDALNDIISSDKIYEGRLNKSYFQDFKIGEIFIFKDSLRKVICCIEEILIFKSFKDVFESLNFKHFNSRFKNKEDTINLYKSLYPKSNLSVIVFKINKNI